MDSKSFEVLVNGSKHYQLSKPLDITLLFPDCYMRLLGSDDTNVYFISIVNKVDISDFSITAVF